MAKINFKPNEDRVLVEPAEAETKTASGIIIPDTAKEKPQKGKIIAVGEGVKDKPVTVKVGDNVLYGKYSGNDIIIYGKEYLIMRNSDIFGII
jgi:chaperonin GroES